MRLPLLGLHISSGVLAKFAGAAAMSFRKGSRQHGAAGSVFVVSMLTMAMAASWLAYMKHQTNNVFGGLLSFYMATAWATEKPAFWIALGFSLHSQSGCWVWNLQ